MHNEFKANLELHRKRSEQQKARWTKENKKWNAWKADNERHLDRKAVQRQAGRDLANKALQEDVRELEEAPERQFRRAQASQ